MWYILIRLVFFLLLSHNILALLFDANLFLGTLRYTIERTLTLTLDCQFSLAVGLCKLFGHIDEIQRTSSEKPTTTTTVSVRNNKRERLNSHSHRDQRQFELNTSDRQWHTHTQSFFLSMKIQWYLQHCTRIVYTKNAYSQNNGNI